LQYKKVTTRICMLSFGTDTGPQSCYHSFIALLMIRWAQNSAVQVCQVTTVVMETMQLVRSQFRNFLAQW